MTRKRKAFIVKIKLNGVDHFNHYLANELHLIKHCIRDSDDGIAQVKETTFEREDFNDLMFQRF